MRALDGTELPRNLGELPADRAQPLGLAVEGRLEVLERECVVEDRHVRRGGGTLSPVRNGQSSQQPRAADGRLPQEAGPCVARDPVDRLRDRAVPVELAEGQAGHQPRNPVWSTAAWTCAAVFGASVASGAGFLPAIARIQPACRASTETILAACASVGFVRFVAWPL
jgi:hypothetical protein